MSKYEKVAQERTVDYSLGFLRKTRWIIVLIVIFFLSFMNSFPIFKMIDQKVHTSLKSIPGCPLEMDDYSFKFFLPRLEIKNFKLPMKCLNKFGPAIKIPMITASPRGISFSPLGLSFKIKTNYQGSAIDLNVVKGFSATSVLMTENIVEMAALKSFLPEINLKGKVKLDFMSTFENNKVTDFKLNARSKNLILPSQTVSSLLLPTMPINNFLLQVKSDANNRIKVEKFIVGDQDSPIRSNFEGNIKLDQRQIRKSTLNIAGEVSFSKSFLENYSIIKLLLGKFDKKDNFYQIKVTGTLASPKTSSPK